jgi:hypothetical protein
MFSKKKKPKTVDDLDFIAKSGFVTVYFQGRALNISVPYTDDWAYAMKKAEDLAEALLSSGQLEFLQYGHDGNPLGAPPRDQIF